MAVETRVFIDADAGNAIREIGKLDEAAADADSTIKELDDQKVDVDTTGGVDGMDELRRMGEEAIESVKALSQQSVDIDVDTSEVDNATGKLDQVRESTDRVGDSGRAGSVAIGGIGNAVSELPGVGALGPLAESVGQLTEAALEGGESMAGLAKSVGLLGGTALVMAGIQKAMQSIADTKAFNEDQIEAFRDALKETNDAAKAVMKTIEAAEGVQGRAGGVFGKLFEGTKDITSELLEAGVAVDTFSVAVSEGGPALDQVIGKLEAARDAAQAEADALEAAGQSNTAAWGESIKTARSYSEAIEITNETLDNNTAAQQKNTDAAAFLATGQSKVAVEFHAARDAVAQLAGKLDSATIATAQLEAANAKLRGDLDKREAYLNLMDQFDVLKAKGQEAWDAAATGASDAESKARAYELAQIDTKNAVVDYTEQVGKVPTDVTTNLLAEVDSGQIDGLKNDIESLNGSVITVQVRAQLDAQFNKAMDAIRTSGARVLYP